MENLLISIFLTILIFIGISTSVLMKNFGLYKKVYRTLKNKTFYLDKTQVYSHSFKDTDDGFVWFVEEKSFRLEPNVFLHNDFITYFSPYSLYWLVKYKKWMKNNIDLKTINKF